MIILTNKGLFCPAGQFYIDPSGAVDHAVITHAHADHARRGSKNYYCVNSGVDLLKARIGKNIKVNNYSYAENFFLNGVKISFHPAGHILGSSQIRMQIGEEVWVASGDYKREKDPTCEPFEVVPCDVFITEATFGTPAFRWNADAQLGDEIYSWWKKNANEGFNSVVFAYSLGKTQRILGELYTKTSKPIYCHSAAAAINDCYRRQGVLMAPTLCLSELNDNEKLSGQLFIVPQSFMKSPQVEILGNLFRTAFASGWMAQRDYNYDHGFLMSDHADWTDLVRTIQETQAKKVFVQHRGHGALVKHLRGLGIKAYPDTELENSNPEQMMLF
jgi:putative mRNA 3-end processing factor